MNRFIIPFALMLLLAVAGYAQTPEIVIQNGHNADISGLAAHPFKNQIASVDASGKIVIWDMDTRMILKQLEVENNYFPGIRQTLKYAGQGNNLFFSSHRLSGHKMMSEHTQNTILRIEDGQRLSRETREIDFAFSADSSLFLTLNEYSTYQESPVFSRSYIYIQSRDSSRQGLNRSFEQKITTFAIARQANVVLLGFFDGTLQALDADDLSLLWEAKGFQGPLTSMDVSEEKGWVALTASAGPYGNDSGADFLMVYDVEDGKLVKQLDNRPNLGGSDTKGFAKALFAPGGDYLAAISGYKLMVWETGSFGAVYHNFPNRSFSTWDQVYSITDMVFSPATGELVLASGSHLFSFDIATQSYSSLFNRGMTEDYDFAGIGITNDSRYYLHSPGDMMLEQVDLSNFESETYDPAMLPALTAKAVKIDTALQSLSHLYAFHPGNVLTFIPDRRTMVVWATPRGHTQNHTENYFMEFDLEDWAYRGTYGPFDWEETEFETYFQLAYMDSENGWYALQGNRIGSVRGSASLSNGIVIRSLDTNEIMLSKVILQRPGILISPSGRYMTVVDTSRSVVVYETESMKEVYRKRLDSPSGIISPVFAPDGVLYVADSDSSLATTITKVQFDPLGEETYWTFNGNVPTAMAASEKYFALGVNYDYSLDKWKDSVDVKMQQFGIGYFTDPNVLVVDRFSEEKSMTAHLKGISGIVDNISLNDTYALVKPYLQPLQVHSLTGDSSGYRITHLKLGEHNVFADSSYYKAPKEALDAIGLRVGSHAFPVENFDVLYNRPDLLMKRIGISPASEVELYHRAYLKRKARHALTAGEAADSFNLEHFPEADILNRGDLPAATAEEKVTFRIGVLDETFGLESWNIFVNGIPLFGDDGKEIKTKAGEYAEVEAEVALLEGENRIKITAVNKSGIRSIPVQRIINREAEGTGVGKTDIYVITIGVSDYEQDEYDLQYAAKDAGDLQDLFSPVDSLSFGTFEKFNFPKDYYGEIHRINLTDAEVNRSSVRKLKEKLAQSRPGDMVLVFLAGHGMLDQEGAYYFAGHDMDFSDPAERGISFQDIQGLFDGIPARKRVLFMDTCQSGELDDTATEATPESVPAVHTYGDTRIVANMKRGVTTLTTGSAGAGTDEFALMKELFADFNSTGTVIISAASGTGFALENDTWKNGVFTYSVIQGLSEYKADMDGNRRITVSELKEYILKEVEILTEGRQTPTTRQENLEFDFRVW